MKTNTQLAAVAVLLIVVAATGVQVVRSNPSQGWLGFALVGLVFLLAVAGGVALKAGR